jgi:hypothetical protein
MGWVGSARVGDGQSGDNQSRPFQLTMASATEGLELETIISMTDRGIHGRSPGCAALMAEANRWRWKLADTTALLVGIDNQLVSACSTRAHHCYEHVQVRYNARMD